MYHICIKLNLPSLAQYEQRDQYRYGTWAPLSSHRWILRKRRKPLWARVIAAPRRASHLLQLSPDKYKKNRKHSGPIGLNLENVHCVNPNLSRQELSPTETCPAAYLETRQVSAPDSVTMEMEKLGRSQKTNVVTETAVRDHCPSIVLRPPELTPSLTWEQSGPCAALPLSTAG